MFILCHPAFWKWDAYNRPISPNPMMPIWDVIVDIIVNIVVAVVHLFPIAIELLIIDYYFYVWGLKNFITKIYAGGGRCLWARANHLV